MRSINLVLPHSTEHSVIGRLRKQFIDVKLCVLSDICYINPSSEKALEELVERMADTIAQLPELNDGGSYYLLLTGFPYASIAAYQLLTSRFKNVSLLIFDSKTKRYVSITDASERMRNIWERKKKECAVKAAGGE